MNVIIYSRRGGRARLLNLGHPITVVALSLLGVLFLGAIFALGLHLGEHAARLAAFASPSALLRSEQEQVATLRSQLQDKVDALAMRLGTIDADMIRLNALGKRLTQMANINSREFDFDHDAGIGGSDDDGVGRGAALLDVSTMLDRTSRLVDFRSAQLSALENVIVGRRLSADIKPQGRPVHEGYISSYFGQRMDPFDGEEAFHKGIDFATEAGADVLSVASGIVIWSGPREGYGNLVEINHGHGYMTRYAHNERTLVNVGDRVERGQAIAVVGSTGRSTGPHVHFEVVKDGRQVDPISFVGR